MARDGTQALGATKRSFSVLGSALTLLVAATAVFAVTRRKRTVHAVSYETLAPPAPIPAPSQPLAQSPESTSALAFEGSAAQVEATTYRRRRLPRFVTGTLFGVGTGIALGIVAVVVLTIADPDVRSAVIVGADFDAPRTSDGEVVARILAQDMNPTLVYADSDVAAELTRARVIAEVSEKALRPVSQDESLATEDVAMLGALVALAVFAWGLVVWGSRSRLTAKEPV